MNGCGRGGAAVPVGICETRTLPAVSAPESAVSELKSAISAMVDADPPPSTSGIIRLQVPIRQRADAIVWLHAQHPLPRCYFSARSHPSVSLPLSLGNGNGGRFPSSEDEDVVSVAGVGSTVFFQGSDPFSLDDWRCIKRFLSKDCPLIRAYGGIRFDPRTNVSPEWKNFGSFYFIIPQVEFDELEESSMLSLNIAWDNTLLWTWQKAINGVQATMHQIAPSFCRSRNLFPGTTIVGFNHVPTKASWDISVKKALQIIKRRNSELVKVVLARCSRYATDTSIDPVSLLACLKVEGQNAYQFFIQPPDAPAFIGNTITCNEVLVEPSKALRKLPRVQHLSAELSGKLRNEDDEMELSPYEICHFNLFVTLMVWVLWKSLMETYMSRFFTLLEMFDRGMYAGPVGWFGGRESEFAVGIRSALMGKGVGTLVYAGAGIVEGTNSSLEWDELDLKASQVQIDNCGKLTVRGKRPLGDGKFLRLEQVFDVPKDSHIDKIRGKFEDARLSLFMPKKEVTEKETQRAISYDKKQKQEPPPAVCDKKEETPSTEKKKEEHPPQPEGVGDDKFEEYKKKAMAWKVRVEEGIEGWLDYGLIDGLMETISKNKEAIAVAAAAFTAGFIISRKLRSS
ncbi:putative Isochorismate synthase 2, chloroplastic [Cocos nucifera]|uniref:Putative Isochorismate synthase 2, chloroplastic n=1 Tax=Cocos nucifera TaxID=13894 RepID=A0A8K0I9Q4_COCNU|nr:putative Isochorismate synthase 2, chloroplastic [Cocos nucifera]